MCGKTTVIKTIAALQILAQLGANVPAKCASFQVFHKILARIGLNEDRELPNSSFIREIREMEFIIRNVSATSLVLVDELFR